MARWRRTSTTSLIHKTLRVAPALWVVFLLGACSSQSSDGDVGALYSVAKHLWGNEGDDVTLGRAAAVPYASIGIRLGGNREQMLVLASNSGGKRLWTSSARIAISTQDGRIMRTVGLGSDMYGYSLSDGGTAADGTHTLHWYANFRHPNLYAVTITCHDRPAGDDKIAILGKDILTQRVDESCSADDQVLDWSFHNVYWIDPSNGMVWRSIQHVHPHQYAIETEILRPPH